MQTIKHQNNGTLLARVRLFGIASLFAVGGHSVSAATYAIQFLPRNFYGNVMNDVGDIAGGLTTISSCHPHYPACYTKNTVATLGHGKRKATPLPLPISTPIPSGLINLRAINSAGWIAGTAPISNSDFTPQAVVWEPTAEGYTLHKLGLLPGNTIARVAGIDDSNRVVGYNTITDIAAPNAAPFLWDPVNGLSDLTTQGFPNDIPLAISPKGTVALTHSWYQLDVLNQVNPNAPTPKGFTEEASAEINDDGNQARFLVSTGSGNIAYLYRYFADSGEWQALSGLGTGHLSSYGIGSINNINDIAGTISSAGVIATGPDGLAQSLTSLLSPAYASTQVTSAGSCNAKGEMLASVVIGRSSARSVKLIPIKPCTKSCLRIAIQRMTAKRVSTCRMKNEVTTVLTATDETGKKLSGVTVQGRFLDDYWLNKRVTGITNAKGVMQFVHNGPGCVGAISFFVDTAKSTAHSFDGSQGLLTQYIIPAS